MVDVEGTNGIVSIQVIGINQTIQRLREMKMQITQAREIALAQVATFVAEEVQASIMGERAETRSVDTGNLANSIAAIPIDADSYSIRAEDNPYPKGNVTAADVALFLEYGTTKIAPRSHFRNTLDRNKDDIVGMFRQAVVDASQ